MPELIRLGPAGTYDLTIYSGYENFEINKNIFCIPTGVNANYSGYVKSGTTDGKIYISGSGVSGSAYTYTYENGILIVQNGNLSKKGGESAMWEYLYGHESSVTTSVSVTVDVYLLH